MSERILGGAMSQQAIFGISVLFSFVVWGLVTAQYLWPALADRSRTDALRPLLLLHGFRFVGLAFLVPGVVSPDIPAAFATPAAYGDLITAILALIALFLLPRAREPGMPGLAVTWAVNIVGSLDLIYAFMQGNRTAIGVAPGLQGAAYFIPTVLVPLLLITHGLMFRLLLRRDAGGHAARPPR
jgi:hypothetical protein